ncbi:hypothetical protein PMIN03_012336, partial [Paraphaeosphaeria minitans]
ITGGFYCPVWSNVSLKEATLENQILVYPRYPLMPEADGKQIAEYAVHLVKIIEDRSIRRELVKTFPHMDFAESNRWVCSGTSAGVFLIIRSVTEHLNTKIDALVLLSPMLEVYIRLSGHKYGQHTLLEMDY